jgi:hypothetical protein
MAMTAFERKQGVLVVEFNRYVMEHPEFAAQIPKGALVVIEIEGQDRFNAWARSLAKRHREPGQTVVWIRAKGLRQVHSRLKSPVIEKVS